MSRLIDADILDDEVMHLFISITGNPKQHTVANECKSLFRRIIEEQPTVEAVTVVHCKDCKQWHKNIGWCDKHSHFINSDGSFCRPWESNVWKMFDENDFCSDGKLRSSAKKSAKKIME